MNRWRGPDVIEFVEAFELVPCPGEPLLEIAAAGVNFMDTGRRGLAWTDVPEPKILGLVGAGHGISVGDGVGDLRPGRRVA